jgi:hypothetical protein
MLLEHFDDEVPEKVRVRAARGAEARNRFERMLMQLTAAELSDAAEFDGDAAFELRRIPVPDLTEIALGRYELPRRTGEAHMYRASHPLAQWVLDVAAGRELQPVRLAFDYVTHGSPVTTLLPLRGKPDTAEPPSRGARLQRKAVPPGQTALFDRDGA